MAEYRELPRIFGLAKNYYNSSKRDDSSIPNTYRLGSGHVKFFYNKLLWLAKRQENIILELLKRGYKIKHTNSSELLLNCPKEYCCDYFVTDESLIINRERIKIRLLEYQEKIKKKISKNKNNDIIR